MFLLEYLLKFFFFMIRMFPYPVRHAIGDCLGILWFDILRIRRGVVLENIQRVFPDIDEAAAVSMGRWSLRNMGRDFTEYSYLPFFNKKLADQLFEAQGLEHLDAALKKNKGVCLLTLHLGNGDLACSALSCWGYKVHLISKLFKVEWLNRFWFGMREKVGTKFIEPRNSSFKVLKALKKKEIVIFVMDQFTGPPIGVKTRFFGHETGTGMGLALMAQRSGAPVVPIYTLRGKGGRHKLIACPEIPFQESENPDESLARMTQLYNSHLESYILECPEQWMWVHKRWKVFRTD